MVKLGKEQYAIALGSIQTIEDIPLSDIKYVQGKEVINLRGNIIPIIRLGELLDVPDRTEPDESLIVVVIKKGDKQAGLVVDSLVGQMEIVIKSLGKYININKMISGATILGDGEVALIIDANAIKQYIVIRINNEFFGIDIMNVDSIVKIQQITRVPKSQDYFIGVINLRGEIVPVMSLRKRFGVEEVPDDSATRIIILKLDQNLVGIKVDMVRDVVALEETDIEKNNIVTENNGQMFIKAVGKHDDELISILGLHSVVIDREQA